MRLGLLLGLLFWALVAIVFTLKCSAMPSHLVYTVPNAGQNCYKTLGDEGDSVQVCDCVGAVQVRQIQTAYLWGARVTGGGFVLVDSHSVLGREGFPDSFPVPFAGNFYILMRNTVGISCASNVATVLPDVVTGIPEEATPPAQMQRWVDVHGRVHMKRPKGSGIYFWQYNLTGQWSKARKIVLLRGE